MSGVPSEWLDDPVPLNPRPRLVEGMNYNVGCFRRAYVLVPVQKEVARILGIFEQFPPRQKPASFTVGEAIEALSSPAALGK